MKKIKNVRYQLLSHEGRIKMVTDTVFNLPKEGTAEGTLFVELPIGMLSKDKTTIVIGVYSEDKIRTTTTTNFLGPRNYN